MDIHSKLATYCYILHIDSFTTGNILYCICYICACNRGITLLIFQQLFKLIHEYIITKSPFNSMNSICY